MRKFLKGVTLGLALVCSLSSLTACGKKGMDATTLLTATDTIKVAENEVNFTEAVTSQLFKDGYVVAEAGFAVSYTVKGDDPTCNWICSGGLYVELDGFEVDVNDDGETDGNLWHNIVVYQDPKQSVKDANACLHIIESGVYSVRTRNEGAEYVTTMPFSVAYNPIDVVIAYYNEAYYVMLDRTFKVKLTAETTFDQTNKTQYLNEFFAPRTRKIGFRSTNAPTTFTNINVNIGDEAAKEAIKDMGLN
ncbi:MAG: hypothetical protein IJX88_05960 [Clostridia bacterium]|nr:hypothetical protein [Clostridia bacterium]